MSVTRPLRLYKSHPELLSELPEGSGSGFLILEHPEDVEYKTHWLVGGTKARKPLKDLPFPQNKLLTVEYSSGEDRYSDKTAFIPVVDQPFNSNSYYVIAAKDGDKKGLAYVCGKKEEGMPYTCCFCCCGIHNPDKAPERLNPYDIDHQFEIYRTSTDYPFFSA